MALAVAACLIALAPPAHAYPRCEAPPSLVRFNAPLPKLAATLTNNRPVRIVALGSSSTQGVGASNPNAYYPVKLQAELRRRFPGRKIRVDNLGIGGQLASDMLGRMASDVLPRSPTLVIWQTGVNDAMRHVDLETFRQIVLRGVDKLKKSGIDVILLDMQYFPRAEKIDGFFKYLQAMRQIAEMRKIPILRRFAIMKHLVKSSQFTARQLLAKDLFHLNDVSYGCLGSFLADAVQARVAKTVAYGADGAKRARAVAGHPVH